MIVEPPSRRRGTPIFIGFVAAIIIAYWASGYRVHSVDGTSMYPTFTDGSMAISKKGHGYTWGDVVILDGSEVRGGVKRVVGVAGDNMEWSSCGLWRNGEQLYGCLDSPTSKTVVSPGAVFVTGDNLVTSYDSREVGEVNELFISAKIVWPSTEPPW